MNKREDWRRIFGYSSWVFIIIMILFLHFYKLTEIPYGLNADEVGSAYDAYSIANYGVDRYTKSFPVYFTNYGDGQNAMYTYLTALFFRLFGISKLTVRLGIALSSLVGGILGFLYASQKWKGTKVSVLLLGLYAILPVFIMTQRFGLESHLLLSASIAVMYTSMKALETEKWQFYFIAGIVMGGALYTYALVYIILPIYLFLWLAYGVYLGKIRMRKLLLLLIPLGLLAAPLIVVQIINAFSLPEMQIGPFTLTRLQEYRSGEIGFQDILRNLKLMFINTLFYDDLSYNTCPRYGTLYYFSLPFLFGGFVKTVREAWVSFRQKEFDCSALVIFWLFGEFVMGCFLKGWSTPNTTRMIGIFMVYLYLITNGIYSVWNFWKKAWQKRVFAGVLTGLYTVSFFFFAHYYFTEYNQQAYPMKWLFLEPYDDVVSFLEENQDADWISRGTCYPHNYMYYLWSYKINPYTINISANGIENFENDFINGYPEKTRIQNNYAVYRKDQASIEFLTRAGYTPISLDKYLFFISPLEEYDLVTEQDSVHFDNMYVQEEEIIFSGWCIDTETDSPFTEYLLEIDNVAVEVQKTERPDVVDVLQRENYLESGFHVMLPPDTLSTCNSLVFTGIREDGSGEIIYQIVRKDN